MSSSLPISIVFTCHNFPHILVQIKHVQHLNQVSCTVNLQCSLICVFVIVYRIHTMVIDSTFEKRCQSIGPPTELSFLSASLSSVLILTNIPGNVLVILAVVLDPNKNLRSPFNWLVVNLAAADLMVGVITLPFSVYYLIKEGLGHRGLSNEMITSHMFFYVSCTASVLSLISLAVERYLAVRKPNTYRTKVTNKRIVLTIAIIWVISLSLPSIYFYVGFTPYGFTFANTSIAVAVLIICTTYSLMRRKISYQTTPRNARKTVTSTASPPLNNEPSKSQHLSLSNTESQSATSYSTEPKPTASEISGEANNLQSQVNCQPTIFNTNMCSSNSIEKKRLLLEAKVTLMFLILLIALLCCYEPSTILMYLVNFCENCSCITLHWFRDFHILFILTNSSINFFCYSLRCSKFKSAFVKLLRLTNQRL